MIILVIIVYVLLFFIALTLLLLLCVVFIPFAYRSEGFYIAGTGRAHIDLIWLFGAISFRYQIDDTLKQSFELRLFQIIPIRIRIKPKQKKESKHSKKDKESKTIITAQGIKNIAQSMGRLFKSYMPRSFILEVKISFDDLYYTGLLCAFIPAFQSMFGRSSCSVCIMPVFGEEMYEGKYEIYGKVVIMVIAMEMLRIFMSGSFKKVKL